MRFIRFISALLFALVMGAATLAGLWTFALKQAESNLGEALENVFGDNVTYGTVMHVYDPTQIHLVVHDLIIQQEILDEQLAIKFGRVDVLRDFYGDFRLVLELPKEINVLVQEGQQTDGLVVKVEGGSIALLQTETEWELQMSARILQFLDQAQENVLLKSGDIYATIQPQAGATLFEAGIKRVGWQGKELDRLFLKVIGADIEQLILKGLTGMLKAQSIEAGRSALVQKLRQMPPSSRTFEVLNLHVAPTDEQWIALAGTVEIDGRLRPAGEWMVSTNQTPWFLKNLGEQKGIKKQVFNTRDFKRDLDDRGGVETFDVSVRLGEARLNGYAIGKLEALH